MSLLKPLVSLCSVLIIYLYQSNSALSFSRYLLTIVLTNSKYILNCVKIRFWTVLLCACVYTCVKSVMSEAQRTAFSSSIHAFVFPPSPLLWWTTEAASSNLRFKISLQWIIWFLYPVVIANVYLQGKYLEIECVVLIYITNNLFIWKVCTLSKSMWERIKYCIVEIQGLQGCRFDPNIKTIVSHFFLHLFASHSFCL